MHPSLLRRMMKLIFSNSSNQYIIATHSNVMLDAQHQKSVYQVKGGKLSTVTRCDTVEDSRELLNDLGVKASDLLQTNRIIWVGGPSDRTFIKRWLELAGSEMEEGLDYSFQYYGGKLLAHYSLDDDLDEFVNILEINKNAYLVLDSDWKDDSKTWEIADLAPRKKKIIDACKDKGIDYWITRGVGIENYVPDEIWTAHTGSAVSLSKQKI